MRILNSTNKLKSTTATGMIGKLVQIKFNLGMYLVSEIEPKFFQI